MLADDIRVLLPKGFEVIGALLVKSDSDAKNCASEAINAVVKLRKSLYKNTDGSCTYNGQLVGAVADLNNGGTIQFFISRNGNPQTFENTISVVYDNEPVKYIWQRGCILQCELPIKIPVYYPVKNAKGIFFICIHFYVPSFILPFHLNV